MLKVGITGGIGSGKTLLCKVFIQLGVPVYNADDEAKKLLDTDAGVKQALKKHFGKIIYSSKGTINRKRLAGIVFKDKKKLELLNSIVHPAVKKDFEKWLKGYKDFPYVIKEAAILFESGAWKGLDYIVTVSSPEKLRVRRVMKRDGVSGKEVLARMSNQANEEERMKRSDAVIYNDGKQMVLPQVLKLHMRFTKGNTR